MSSELPTESETKPEAKHQVLFLTEEEASKPSTVNSLKFSKIRNFSKAHV